MKNDVIPLADTGTVKPLMKKYLENNPSLHPFTEGFPSLEEFKTVAGLRAIAALDRKTLVRSIQAQYAGLECAPLTRENIMALKNDHTFTVTTGHQLCLFTGPLYFVIKILNAVKLADDLNAAYPGFRFVPVYWMGAEDHDFSEINHFRIFRKTLTWKSAERGAVGRFGTRGLESIYNKLMEILGPGEKEVFLLDLFKRAYLEHETLAEATRFLVNELFGKKGLVVIDGDRPELKRLFLPYMEAELREKAVYEAVNQTIPALKKHGKIQVNPREVSLFYLEANARRRIVLNEDGSYSLDGRDETFKKDKMLAMLRKNPGKFSPNVLLRPVFQELLLPNVAYVGGTGEIAYWLELKGVFHRFKLPMPLLVVRNSFMFISPAQSKKLEKLGLVPKDLFIDEHALEKKVIKVCADDINFEKENKGIAEAMELLKQKAMAIEPTLEQVFEGEKRKIIKSVNALEKRLFKALKLKNEQKINQVKIMKERLFPGGVLQERIENFSGFYTTYGETLFDLIYKNIEPLEPRMNILV